MYRDKVCVVIGGAVGAGKKAVEKMAADGGIVAFMDTDKEAGCRLRDELIEQYCGEVWFFHGDAASEEDTEIFTAAVNGQFGEIDYLVNHVPSRAFMI